jgi:hypothetical protein
MGKLSKQRRFQRRKDAKTIAQLTEQLNHAQSVAAFAQHREKEFRDASEKAKYQLAGIVNAIREMTSSSALLPVESKIESFHGSARVAINPRPQRFGVDLLDDLAATMTARNVETLTQFLLYDAGVQAAMTKHLHFQVMPDRNRQPFTCGYGVTKTVMETFRDRDVLVRMICREFGSAIHWELFGKGKI